MGKRRTGAAMKAKQQETAMREVQPLREPVAMPEHCGAPMRKFSGPASTGGLRIWWRCAKECGHVQQGEVIR